MFFPINRAFLYSLFLLPLSAHSISDEDFKSFKAEMRTRVDDLEREMEDNKREMEGIKKEIEKNQASITELSLHGQWCGYTGQWTTASTVISYDWILFEDSDMTSNALDSGTGKALIKHQLKAMLGYTLRQIRFEYLTQQI